MTPMWASVGQYEIAPGFVLTVTREGERLMSQATGQLKSEPFPESETVFFVKDADAQFTFVKGSDGQVVEVKIRRATRELHARKIQ
jgi:serine-type D-Ala-D-Ala carboxypeptidase/endopeptidase